MMMMSSSASLSSYSLVFLPAPSRLCFRRCLSLSACLAQKTSERICMKFSEKVGNGPLNKRLNFGGNPDHCPDTGIVVRIRHYWKIQKVVNGHSFILIRQTAHW